jgi:fumarate reductase iron-sulfur subunit
VSRIALEVFRFRPDEEDATSFQTYEVEYRDDWVVLDALNFVKNELDGTLSFRWSCRMGICGSCGMNVNGEPVLTCAAYLRDYAPGPVRVEPLSHFPVVRDLVIDLTDFLDKLQGVKPWLVRREPKPVEEGEHLQTPEELSVFGQFSLCINCLLCYAACPIYSRHEPFVGPAALALAHRYNLDSRDQGREEREVFVAGRDGLWECTFVGDCSRVCPKHVDPAGAIQQAKVAGAMDYFKQLLPFGGQS